MPQLLHLALVVGALALSALGSPIVRLAFRWAKIPDVVTAAEQTAEPARELLRGGRTIGMLERVAVTGLLLWGYPAGIAAIVAIKGLGRFHELKGPNGSLASEKFVIGTLTSYLWAGLIAVIASAIRPLI